jgi:hypothetical protein
MNSHQYQFDPRRIIRIGIAAVIIMLMMVPLALASQTAKIEVVSDQAGDRLQVDGQNYMIFGMNWDYIPIGQNYSYSLWNQPDDIIVAALDREMLLLQNMGVNTIRMYVGIPPRWVRYIYEKYGIYTVLNHPMGRYGVTIEGIYYPTTDYSDPNTRAALISEMETVVREFQGVPGVLMWLLGNENNYGLSWKSAETEALPEGERQAAKARYLYSLFNDVIGHIKAIDPDRPVAICNGDLQYIDIIAEEVTDLDIFGSNVYRGISFRDFFDVVKQKLNVPVLFTEFGADAFNAKEMREDQFNQARYLLGQWREIYEQSSGKGLVGNAIGGLTFQFSDGWWKYKQNENLEIHDINASWPNGGYPEDLVEGENNMNEEWWGICAKGFPDNSGLYQLYPRAAYYALQRAYRLPPYTSTTTLDSIRAHFGAINPMAVVLTARGDRAAHESEITSKVRVSNLRIELETISTGGDRVSTPDNAIADPESYPSFRGFDHLESYYTDIEAKPADNVRGTLSLNYIGHVPGNPIDEIFYENRGRPKTVLTPDDPIQLQGIERLKVYSADITWADRWFDLHGFYRTGHYHWGYQGDFFGLYQEANYGPNIDIYNGEAPLGFELTTKKSLDGLKVALGQELWWGANPAILLKYQRRIGAYDAAIVYQDDLDNSSSASSSIAVPLPPTKKATLYLATTKGPFTVEFGGIWSGDNKVGQPYQIVKGSPGSYSVLQAFIESKDTYGAKVKVSYSKGRINWYLQAASMGLVADGGPTAVQTFTGWRLKDSGKGNQRNLLTGFTYLTGNLQIAPNFLWQKPVVGPVSSDVPAPGRPRNVLDDPFAVRENRETIAGELLITYDPTPATWMYDWDNDIREDARLAISAGLVVRDLPTTQDASIGIMADGRTTFAFPGAPPPRDFGDIWEVYARIVSKVRPGLGFITNLYGGTGEPNGDDARLVHRYGVDLRLVRGSTKFIAGAKFNDWGPYDYHRDGNLTYPLQLIGDVSTSVGLPDWFDRPQTRIGVKVSWRSLDQYSPRYCPAQEVGPLGEPVCVPGPGYPDGNEWEIRTYLHLNVGL